MERSVFLQEGGGVVRRTTDVRFRGVQDGGVETGRGEGAGAEDEALFQPRPDAAGSGQPPAKVPLPTQLLKKEPTFKYTTKPGSPTVEVKVAPAAKTPGGKSPAATKEQIAAAWKMYQAGSKHKATADALGLTEKQVATLVWKVKHQKIQIEEELKKVEIPTAPKSPAWKKVLAKPTEEKPVYGGTTPPTAPSWFKPKVEFTGPLAHANPEKWPLKPGELRNMVKGLGGAELKPKLEESAKSWFNSKLEEAEKSVVKHYTSHGYRAINKYLRGLSDSTSTASKNELELQAKRLNSALTKSQSPPPPEIVWRGISDASDPHWQRIVAKLSQKRLLSLTVFSLLVYVLGRREPDTLRPHQLP